MTQVTAEAQDQEAEQAEGEEQSQKQDYSREKSAAERFEAFGLIIAPLLIAGLAALIYFYYQSLDLSNAVRQQREALLWDQKLLPQIKRHVYLASVAAVAVIAIAVPLGVLLTRKAFRKAGNGVLAVVNSGQAAPAYGLLAIALTIFGLGPTTAILTLIVYATLPVLLNTMVGLDAVEDSIIEAGRGMGMTRAQVLFRIELPLAVPVIIAGLRTAMIIAIGTAALAFAIGGGGLGDTIFAGIQLRQYPVLYVGAGLVVLVALTFDWLGALAERFLKPRGI